MSPQRSKRAVGFVIAAAVAIGGFLLLFERHTFTAIEPPSAKVRTNPYAALELFLTEMGVEARTVPALVEMPPTDCAVIWFAPLNAQFGTPDDLYDWLLDGGHLLWGRPAGGDDAAPGWLKGFLHRIQNAELVPPGKPAAVRQGKLQVGAGHVTHLARDLGYQNDVFLTGDAGGQLWRSMLLAGLPKRVLIVAWPRSKGMWALLLEHAWPALISLLVLIVAWLWAAATFIGPIRHTEAPVRRSMAEHIAASGLLLWRTKQIEQLVAVTRRSLLERLVTRLPSVAGLRGEARRAAVAQTLGITPEQVRRALDAPCPDRRTLVDCMRAQQQLESKL